MRSVSSCSESLCARIEGQEEITVFAHWRLSEMFYTNKRDSQMQMLA